MTSEAGHGMDGEKLTHVSLPGEASRPMDGTGTLRQRGRDGQPIESYFGGANVHGGYWVQQVDAWPHGPLQAQLDRIEAKLAGDRWAAFTNDELEDLNQLAERAEYGGTYERLWDEIQAEIERRKA